MNKSELQELRDWAARKMGWTMTPAHTERGIRTVWNIVREDGAEKFIMYRGDWLPDKDLNQTFMLVEKMRGEGWWISIDSLSTPNHYDVEFIHRNYNPREETPEGAAFGSSQNPALAILLAARATEDSQP